MRAEVVERRQAVVSRLLALRADGRLQSQVVRAAAESLGVTERTVWRWLAAASYDPRWRIGWRTTDEAVEAFYRTGGRSTAAWHLLRDEGIPVPSHTAFCRALERDISLAERAYARHGEDGRRRYSVYRRWEPKARNDVWAWAAFTHTASRICHAIGAAQIDQTIARNAISQLGTSR